MCLLGRGMHKHLLRARWGVFVYQLALCPCLIAPTCSGDFARDAMAAAKNDFERVAKGCAVVCAPCPCPFLTQPCFRVPCGDLTPYSCASVYLLDSW